MIHQSSINVEVDEEPLYPLTWQFTVVLQLLHGAPAGRVLEPHPALRLLRDPGGRLHGRLGHPLPAEVARPLFQGMHQNIYHLPFHHNLLRPLTLSYTSKVLMLWCECLKVSDTPLNAIKVMMRWISLSINPQLLYFLARFRVRATWWRWEAMTGTPACCSSAQASASAIGGSRVSSSRNNLDFLHSFRGKRPVPC